MADIKHSGRAHAMLGASGAKRWMACTPSAMLEDTFSDKSSVYADEGTSAHELSELELSFMFGMIDEPSYDQGLDDIRASDKHYSQSMHSYVNNYTDIVHEHWSNLKGETGETPVIFLEQKLSYSTWVPDGFGTGDVILVAGSIIEVIDLKYGTGVPVSAIDNPQIRLYALGAYDRYDMLYDFDRIRMTIVQPRLDSVTTEEMSVKDLLTWAETEVAPKAALAAEGKGEFVPGEHCGFCKARQVCRARAMANLELAKFEFRDPPLLTHEEIAGILKSAGMLGKWAKDVEEYAYEQAVKQGVRFEGWKLVEGRSNRKITDEAEAVRILIKAGITNVYHQPKLKGLGDLETLAGGKKKFEALVKDLIIKPPGAPALVPVEDKRTELSSVASAAEAFNDGYVDEEEK